MQSLTLSDLRARAPSIFATQPFYNVSDRYQFIPTIDVVNRLMEEGFEPVFATQSRTRHFNRREHVRHLIRFRPRNVEAVVGEFVPEIVLENSHGAVKSCYKLHGGIYRFVCANGMVVSDGGAQSIRVLHNRKTVVDDVIEGSFTIIKEIPQVLDRVEQMRSIKLNEGEQGALARAAAMLRWDPDTYVVPEQGLLRRTRAADVKDDLWTTFNVIQEKVINGNVPIYNMAKDCSVKARAINSVSENVKLNKALWTLADEMANIKTA